MSWNLLDNLLGSAVLMVLVLAVRRPVGQWCGARAAFALWLAPLARLLAPQLPLDAPMPDILIQTQTVAAGAVEPVRAALPLDVLLIGAWATGAALFLAIHLVRYALFVRSAVADGRTFEMAADMDVPVVETALVSGPAAAGLLKRRIFVPPGFAHAFDADQQRLALKHELLHHRRGDLWASAGALAVLALHWFNPLAYVAHRAFRRDLESACDADLLAGAGGAERHLYAGTILRCVARPIPHPVCALTDSKELKGRLKMMKQDVSFARRLSGAAIAAALSGGGLFLAVPASAQQPAAQGPAEERTEVHKVIIRDGKGEREISPELRAKMENCPGEKFEVTTGAQQPRQKQEWKVKRAKILICGKPGESKEQMAASLEKALGRIESQSELSADVKADMVAKIKARIAELRAGQ